MADHLLCGLCEQAYNGHSRLPKFLKCGGELQHTFCLQCLTQLTVEGMVCCPSCSDLTAVPNGAQALSDNIYLMPQINAAAAAKHGVQSFCRTCGGLAGRDCRGHQLLAMPEARDLLRELAVQVTEQIEQIKHNRTVVLRLYRSAHNVLTAAADAARRAVDEFDMDLQLDDDILCEVERRREAVDAVPDHELADTYDMINTHLMHTAPSVKETAAVAKQCQSLLDSRAQLSLLGGVELVAFPIGEWLQDANVAKAVLAASTLFYCLDPGMILSSDNGTGSGNTSYESSAVKSSCDAAKGDSGVKFTGLATGAVCKPSTVTNGSLFKGTSNSQNKLDKIRTLSSKPDTTKASTSSTSQANAHSSDKHDSSISATTPAKTASAKPSSTNKTATVRNGTATTESASQLTFSGVVKKPGETTAVARAALVAPVARPLRGLYPLYNMVVTNGTNRSNIIIELRPDMAPIMCQNFVKLSECGHFNNTHFHFAVPDDYVLGGRIDREAGFSPLAIPPEKYVMADQCPLKDECGAIRMKGAGTVMCDGEKRGMIGSQFMIWLSETREYLDYRFTLVFGYVRQGLDFLRTVSTMDRPDMWHNVRIISCRRWVQ